MNNKTRMITTVGAMSALSVLLVFFIHFPIFSAVPFLEYDPADILIYLVTYVFGIPTGLIMTAIVSVLQGVTVSAGSGIVGIIMHFVATGTYVLIAGIISRINSEKKTVLVISTFSATVVTTAVMMLWNLVVTPLFMGATVEQVIAILYLIVLFNIIKTGVNGIIAAILVKPTKKIINIQTKK